MYKKFVLEIKIGGEIVANVYRSVLFATPENVLPFSMLWVKDLIYNYNMCLSHTMLNNIPLAVRMLQEENEEGSHHTLMAIFHTNSASFLEDAYPYFLLQGINADEVEADVSHGVIGILREDMEINRFDVDMQTIIDFDNKTVNFCYDFTRLDYSSWEFLQDQSNIPELNVCPYNFKEIAFNDLSDARDFLSNNKHGFIAFDEVGDKVTTL